MCFSVVVTATTRVQIESFDPRQLPLTRDSHGTARSAFIDLKPEENAVS